MYQPYFDIREKLGEPLWHDANGVPRYVPFAPSESANIYAQFVALMEIRCQGCGKLMLVEANWDVMNATMDLGNPHDNISEELIVWDDKGQNPIPKAGLPKVGEAGAFTYGDAPWHGDNQCSGTTMTTSVNRIVEFWKRVTFDWERMPQHEVHIGEE
jgi:hypothetical protein